jgi:hypothetical protein
MHVADGRHGVSRLFFGIIGHETLAFDDFVLRPALHH